MRFYLHIPLFCRSTKDSVWGMTRRDLFFCTRQSGVTMLKPSLVSSVLLNLFMQTEELYKFKSSLALNVVKGKQSLWRWGEDPSALPHSPAICVRCLLSCCSYVLQVDKQHNLLSFYIATYFIEQE